MVALLFVPSLLESKAVLLIGENAHGNLMISSVVFYEA